MTTDANIEIPAEWEAAYDTLFAKFGRKWTTFPTRDVYRELVKFGWLEMYRTRSEGLGLTVEQYAQRRLAARERLGGPLGPVTVVKRASDAE